MQPSRREERREATLQEIKDLAWQQMAENGPASLSLREISRRMRLSSAAILYAGFDGCALRFWPTSKWPLLAIGLLNLAYCLAATSVCLLYRESLTHLGAAYFFLEACIVVPLAIVEIRASKKI